MTENNVVVIKPSGRKDWLAQRRQDVTASQIAALLDLHPYTSRLQIFLEKTGKKISDDDLDSAAMMRGRKLEHLAFKEAQAALPDVDMTYNEFNTYYRDPLHRIGATPDVTVEGDPRGRGVIQLKSIEPSIYRKTWPNGEPPIWIALQAVTEAKLVGAQWAAVGALRVGHGVEFDLTDIPLANNAWATILEAVADFWTLVDGGLEPPPNYARDAELITALAGASDSGVALDLSGDNELVAALHDREEAKALMKDLEAQVKQHDAQIRHKAGAAEVVTAGDFRVTLRTTEYKGYTVAQRTARPINVKRIRGEAPTP